MLTYFEIQHWYRNVGAQMHLYTISDHSELAERYASTGKWCIIPTAIYYAHMQFSTSSTLVMCGYRKNYICHPLAAWTDKAINLHNVLTIHGHTGYKVRFIYRKSPVINHKLTYYNWEVLWHRFITTSWLLICILICLISTYYQCTTTNKL